MGEVIWDLNSVIYDLISSIGISIKFCFFRTVNLLEEKRDILENLANVLLEKETIERQDLVTTLGERPFKEMTTYEEYVEGTGSIEENTELPEGLKGWKEPAKEEESEKSEKK